MSTEEEEDRSEDRVIQEEVQEADRPMDDAFEEDRTLDFERTGESRMRTEWLSEDGAAIRGLHDLLDRQMLVHFAGAYQVMNEFWEIVRNPAVNEKTGEIEKDVYGWTVWTRNEFGAFDEDYTKLTHADIKHFLFKITTQLFGWEQAAATLRGDSLYAKAVWRQSFARGYQDSRTSGGRTVEDRVQAGTLASEEDRFFGLFETVLSQRADALVRSMTTISQRLKDVLVIG